MHIMFVSSQMIEIFLRMRMCALFNFCGLIIVCLCRVVMFTSDMVCLIHQMKFHVLFGGFEWSSISLGGSAIRDNSRADKSITSFGLTTTGSFWSAQIDRCSKNWKCNFTGLLFPYFVGFYFPWFSMILVVYLLLVKLMLCYLPSCFISVLSNYLKA